MEDLPHAQGANRPERVLQIGGRGFVGGGVEAAVSAACRKVFCFERGSCSELRALCRED